MKLNKEMALVALERGMMVQKIGDNQYRATPAEKPGMTKRETEMLDFVKRYRDKYGYSPSYEEMVWGIGLSAKGNAHRIIHNLADKGYVKTTLGRARSVRPVS